jgi:Lamin Tail Domain
MSDLSVTRALPNPIGRDRSPSNQSLSEQLTNEWIEFANASTKRLSLEQVVLAHFTFDRSCSKIGEETVTGFSGVLEVGQSMRVHTGAGKNSVEESIIHVFLSRGNFIWNNDCGDTVVLRVGNNLLDSASYERKPREGAILERVPGTNVLL